MKNVTSHLLVFQLVRSDWGFPSCLLRTLNQFDRAATSRVRTQGWGGWVGVSFEYTSVRLYFMITNIYVFFILFLFSDNQSNFLYFQAALQLSIFYRYRVGVTVQSWQIWKNLAIFGFSAQVVKLKILTSLSHLIQMSKINWGRSLGKLFSIFSNMNSMWRQM